MNYLVWEIKTRMEGLVLVATRGFYSSVLYTDLNCLPTNRYVLVTMSVLMRPTPADEE
jgi:hypothetical protein